MNTPNPTPPADNLSELEATIRQAVGISAIFAPENMTVGETRAKVESLTSSLVDLIRRRDEAHRAKLLEAVERDEFNLEVHLLNARQAIAEVYGNTSTEIMSTEPTKPSTEGEA